MTRYADQYVASTNSVHVRRRQQAGVDSVLLHLDEPEGDFSARPTDDLILGESLNAYRFSSDFGAGRFSEQARRGRLFLSPPHTATSIQIGAAHTVRLLCLPDSLVRRNLEGTALEKETLDFGRLHSRSFASALISASLDHLSDGQTVMTEAGRLFVDTLLLTITIAIASLEQRPASENMRGRLAPWQVRRTTDYIHQHVAENIELADLAAISKLSTFHFCRMFKNSVGQSPHRYQIKLRVDRARQLLVCTDMGLDEVAVACGYSSQQALARVFRQEVGYGLGQYRRQSKS